MPRTKDQASRNVGGNANKDSNGDKQNSRMAAATPNRRDAYMAAKKSSGAVSKPVARTLADKVTDNLPRISYAPNMSRVSGLAPTSSPRAKSAPSTVSKLAPTKVPRPMPAAPARAVRANQAKFNRAASLGDDGPKVARFAPAKGPRPVANPNKKQRTYPGRTRYNYAV